MYLMLTGCRDCIDFSHVLLFVFVPAELSKLAVSSSCHSALFHFSLLLSPCAEHFWLRCCMFAARHVLAVSDILSKYIRDLNDEEYFARLLESLRKMFEP